MKIVLRTRNSKEKSSLINSPKGPSIERLLVRKSAFEGSTNHFILEVCSTTIQKEVSIYSLCSLIRVSLTGVVDNEEVCDTEKDLQSSDLDKDGSHMSTYVAKGDYSIY